MPPIFCAALLALAADGPCPEAGIEIPLYTPARCVNGCSAERELYVAQPGDIFIFHSSRLEVQALYLLACCPGAHHVGIAAARPDGTVGLLEVPAAKEVVLRDIASRVVPFSGTVSVRRLKKPLTAEESARLTEFACAQQGKRFSFLSLLAPPVSWPTRLVTRRCLTCEDINRPSWICSSLVVTACVVIGRLDSCLTRPCSACANDLCADKHLDLSCDWEAPVPLCHDGAKACSCGAGK